jgi:hypothetical protein
MYMYKIIYLLVSIVVKNCFLFGGMNMITYKRTKIKCPEVPEYKNDAVTGY